VTCVFRDAITVPQLYNDSREPLSSESKLKELRVREPVRGSEREIVAAESRERSEVEPGVQKNTGGRPVII
jgi:hypothetical protein